MNNLLIHIPANEKTKFSVYLSLMNNFIGIIEDGKFKLESLTPREIEVLSLLSYYNKIYSALPEDVRSRFLHSNEIRKQIKAELELTTNNYNNILGRLSSKVLVFNKQPLYDHGLLNPGLAVDITNYDGIEFRFKEKS